MLAINVNVVLSNNNDNISLSSIQSAQAGGINPPGYGNDMDGECRTCYTGVFIACWTSPGGLCYWTECSAGYCE